MRIVAVLVSIAALVALVVAPVMAQTTAPAPAPTRPAPGAGPAVAPEPTTKEVEGTVKKVDPGKKSVEVSSGLLGLFGATLEVDDSTKIQVEGKDGSIADIREGARVKASYESRDGKNVAKSIDVMPGEEEKAAGSPARPAAPAGSSAPSSPPAGGTQPGSPPKTQ